MLERHTVNAVSVIILQTRLFGLVWPMEWSNQASRQFIYVLLRFRRKMPATRSFDMYIYIYISNGRMYVYRVLSKPTIRSTDKRAYKYPRNIL